VTVIPPRLAHRPTFGGMVVPFMVDLKPDPISFALLDTALVSECARQRLCGICGQVIERTERLAFLGATTNTYDQAERDCFGDPWMHEECARYSLATCPFIAKRRRFREAGSVLPEIAENHAEGWSLVIARNGRAFYDGRIWHFHPNGIRKRELVKS